MNTPVTAGIDPGARSTGFIIRQGTELVDRALYMRGKTQSVEHFAQETATRILEHLEPYKGRVDIKIEQVVHPTGYDRHGQQRSLNPGHVTDTALVAGYIAGQLSTVFTGHVAWITPGGHGSPPANLPRGRALNHYMTTVYPEGLHPTRIGPNCAWTDDLRHLRSAWDISTARPAITC